MPCWEVGVLYQVDPTSPFTEVQENPMVVDSISLPRDTLKRITGDCDDLTVLFCSIFETVGVETGFITVPGHIYAAFNTGEQAREYNRLGIAHARFMRYGKAVEAFDRAIELEPNNMVASINKANVLFLKQDYKGALKQYEEAAGVLEQSGRSGSRVMLKLLVNISRTCYQLERYSDVKDYLAKAEAIDPEEVKDYSYLAAGGGAEGAGRAAEERDVASEVLFIEEE